MLPTHPVAKSADELSATVAELEVRVHGQEVELRRQRRWGLIAIVSLGACCGWLCFCANYAYLTDHFRTPAQPMVRVVFRDVPMAVVALPPGAIIRTDDLGMGKVVVSQLTPTVLLSERVIVGKRVKTPINAATPIRAEQLERIELRDGAETSPDNETSPDQ